MLQTTINETLAQRLRDVVESIVSINWLRNENIRIIVNFSKIKKKL